MHCVSAYQEVIEIKKQLKISVPMIIHGFSKNIQVAESLNKNGFYLSFGKYLLRNPELSNVLKQVPTEFLFLETDMIEETIDQVYAKASLVLETDVEKIIEQNYIKVFNRD